MSVDRDCKCGCGEQPTEGRNFLPGHDQKAIHDRIKTYGTVEDWLYWEDEVLPVILDAIKLHHSLHSRFIVECNLCNTWEMLQKEWNFLNMHLKSKDEQ